MNIFRDVSSHKASLINYHSRIFHFEIICFSKHPIHARQTLYGWWRRKMDFHSLVLWHLHGIWDGTTKNSIRQKPIIRTHSTLVTRIIVEWSWWWWNRIGDGIVYRICHIHHFNLIILSFLIIISDITSLHFFTRSMWKWPNFRWLCEWIWFLF